ncbi:class IV adenylate cyclase [Desulfovibrio subterraneus]|uniref:Adenylate cyclase n=1 Tax=Desulfovibrio subterraneus TaxID=2718620 RepID=A0A7J0BK14_9BACT|nr:class IV adenylate cyclase [Desulfovibrio subterraneus]GFM34133.1 adenylate cyclase [Desulfovibrio subterraneus]
MAFETELKFVDADFAALRKKLAELGAECRGSHVERNLVFDTPERSFKNSDMLLRLRTKIRKNGETAVLTLKRPPQVPVPADVKVYDERETTVENFDGMRGILEGMGYDAAFRYEKMREEWKLDGVEICLDSMPFGDVAELEGEREAIFTCAARIGLRMEQANTGTYHDLNRNWRAAQGLPHDDNFCFSTSRLHELLEEL